MRKMVIVRVKRSSGDASSAPVRPVEDKFIKDEPQGLTREEILDQHVARGKILVLHERVNRLCEEYNRISDQAQRVGAMDDDEFDPDTAVGLLQRIAVLDGMATVLARKLEDVGFDENAIQTCRGIRSNAELMYSDLKHRFSGKD